VPVSLKGVGSGVLFLFFFLRGCASFKQDERPVFFLTTIPEFNRLFLLSFLFPGDPRFGHMRGAASLFPLLSPFLVRVHLCR